MFVRNVFQDKNNNTDDSTAIATATATSTKSGNKKPKTVESGEKSAKVPKTKKKHADLDLDDDDGTASLDNNNAKRMKIATTVTVTVSVETTVVDSSESIEQKTQNAQHNKPSLESSSSPSSPRSASRSKIAAADDVIIILDSSIDSNCSLDMDSFRSNRAANYNFDALNTDDETDTEDNTPYAPEWSKFHNRNGFVIDQGRVNAKVIDEFFGCRAESVDCTAIFPNTVPIARRRSTAVWNTPPRYSLLPKY